MAKKTVHSAADAKAWPHTDKRQEITVDGVKHLYLVVQPAPSTTKAWAWRATPKGGGKITKLTLGSLAEHDFFAAVAWAKGENAKREEGVDVRQAREIERAAAAMLADQALKAEGERQAKTVKWYYDEHYAPRYLNDKPSQRETKRLFDVVLIPAIGAKPISEITRRDLAAVVNKLAETAPVSANRLVNITGTLFKRAVEVFGDETDMDTNPAQYLAKPYDDEHANRKQPVVERQQLGYVLSVVERGLTAVGGRGAYARALKLLLATGVRRGEALGAKWSEFDLKAGTWTIPKWRSKNKLPHLVPLAPKLLAWLKTLAKDKEPDSFLFTADGSSKAITCLGREQGKLYTSTMALAARDKVELGDWSPHALRRTFSTTLSSLTDDALNPLVPPHVIEALLNHQSGAAKAGVAGIYNKYQYQKEKTAALKIWEKHLETVLQEEIDRNRMAVVMGDVAEALAENHRKYPAPAKKAA